MNHPICTIRDVIWSPNRIFQNSESIRARSRKGPRPFAVRGKGHSSKFPLRAFLRPAFMPAKPGLRLTADSGPDRVS
jgi:hypothetical protein